MESGVQTVFTFPPAPWIWKLFMLSIRKWVYARSLSPYGQLVLVHSPHALTCRTCVYFFRNFQAIPVTPEPLVARVSSCMPHRPCLCLRPLDAKQYFTRPVLQVSPAPAPFLISPLGTWENIGLVFSLSLNRQGRNIFFTVRCTKRQCLHWFWRRRGSSSSSGWRGFNMEF